MKQLFPLLKHEQCYCDVILYDKNLFNLKLRAYTEPDHVTQHHYQYYLLDFFFTIYFQGPTFWQGMSNRRGSDEEMRQLASFALDRRREMRPRGEPHFPKLYCIFPDAVDPVYIMAGVVRIYEHASTIPLAFNVGDGDWFASWPIIFEEGFPGQEEMK